VDFNEADYGLAVGINWTICNSSAPLSRQITTLAPRHSVFLPAIYFPGNPTNRVKTPDDNEKQWFVTQWCKQMRLSYGFTYLP